MIRGLLWTSVACSALAIGAGAPASFPESLEDRIALALRSNPEILTAEAKVREAEAELNQVRLRVVQDVVASHHERERQVRVMDSAREQLARVSQLIQKGVKPTSERVPAETAVFEADAKCAQIEAALRYLMGVGEGAKLMESARLRAKDEERPPAPPVRPREIGAKVEELLAMPVSVAFDSAPLRDVAKTLGTLVPSLPFLLDSDVDPDSTLTLSLEDVPFSAVLQAITDAYDGLCFVFRDYGVFMTTCERASCIYAPAIPPNLPLDPEAVPPGEAPGR
ncbi:MAG: hypothetical protein JXP34_05755 [Planctomycetes bacterium]|nr:hypothetical protein [Planctomycetota bacterium]